MLNAGTFLVGIIFGILIVCAFLKDREEKNILMKRENKKLKLILKIKQNEIENLNNNIEILYSTIKGGDKYEM